MMPNTNYSPILGQQTIGTFPSKPQWTGLVAVAVAKTTLHWGRGLQVPGIPFWSLHSSFIFTFGNVKPEIKL